MIRSKVGKRLVGVLVLAVGAGFTAWGWYTALTEGYYYRMAAVIFPGFTVIGLGMALFPIDEDKLRAELGVEQIRSFRQLPLAWKVLLFVALVAGFGNWYALKQL
jgi:hypothetical protein